VSLDGAVRAAAEPHVGDTGGASWLVDPARDLVVIVLTQRLFESPALPPSHREIQAAARAAVA
jgi:CubicO group peptidase (beta-lactamase class C family)